MNRCKKAGILIPLSFYNELEPKESEKLHRHLKICDACKEEYRATMASLGSLPDDQKMKLNKEEFIQLEEMIKNKISCGTKEKLQIKESGISLSYALLMVVLLVTAILALKNPVSYKESERLFNLSASNGLFFPDVNPEAKSGLLNSEDRPEIGEYPGNTPDSEMIAIINNLVSIIYNDKDTDVRKTAIISLAQIGTPLAVNSLKEVSRSHPDPAIRIEAIRCLARLSKESYERRHLIEI